MERTAVDLFCGSGGLSLGLAMAGFDVLAGVDIWQAAVDTYKENYPEHDGIRFDLSDEDGTVELVSDYSPMLIAGGPPCQDFSIAGKRSEGVRADLTLKFARVVSRVRPIAFLMENVPHASTMATYRRAKEIMKEAGYGITMQVVDAALCGVPQYRKRLFMIGMLGQNDGFLDFEFGRSILDGKPTTMREYFGTGLGFEHYYRHPRTYGRRAIYSIDEPCPTIRGVSRPKPANYRKHPQDSADPSEVDALGHRERALIQSFPESYIWPTGGPKAVLELLIGNAVPPRMAARVGSVLYQYMSGVLPATPAWRYVEEGPEYEPLPLAAE